MAVKFLRREVVNWRYFQQELHQLSRISEHPGVVTLLDADLEHTPPCCVMPLLKAGSLAQDSPTVPGGDLDAADGSSTGLHAR